MEVDLMWKELIAVKKHQLQFLEIGLLRLLPSQFEKHQVMRPLWLRLVPIASSRPIDQLHLSIQLIRPKFEAIDHCLSHLAMPH